MTFNEFRKSVIDTVEHLTVIGTVTVDMERIKVNIKTTNPRDDQFLGLYKKEIVSIDEPKPNHYIVKITNQR